MPIIKDSGDFDMKTAFAGMKKDYEFYTDDNVDRKLEKAYHAYIAMKMAQVLGKDEEAMTLNEGS